MRVLRIQLLVALIASMAGCTQNTLQVTSMQLGRSLNEDKTVAEHTTTFAPTDTVYLCALSTGIGSGTVGVRWMYGNQLIGEPKKEISSRDGSYHEFHLNNAGGFPLGEYSAEVFFNGKSVAKREFRVEKR